MNKRPGYEIYDEANHRVLTARIHSPHLEEGHFWQDPDITDNRVVFSEVADAILFIDTHQSRLVSMKARPIVRTRTRAKETRKGGLIYRLVHRWLGVRETREGE